MVEDRCKHDLLEGTCSDCAGISDKETEYDFTEALRYEGREAKPDENIFVAQFPGKCTVCGGEIIPGEEIRRCWVFPEEYAKGITKYKHETCP